MQKACHFARFGFDSNARLFQVQGFFERMNPVQGSGLHGEALSADAVNHHVKHVRLAAFDF